MATSRKHYYLGSPAAASMSPKRSLHVYANLKRTLQRVHAMVDEHESRLGFLTSDVSPNEQGTAAADNNGIGLGDRGKLQQEDFMFVLEQLSEARSEISTLKTALANTQDVVAGLSRQVQELNESVRTPRCDGANKAGCSCACAIANGTMECFRSNLPKQGVRDWCLFNLPNERPLVAGLLDSSPETLDRMSMFDKSQAASQKLILWNTPRSASFDRTLSDRAEAHVSKRSGWADLPEHGKDYINIRESNLQGRVSGGLERD